MNIWRTPCELESLKSPPLQLYLYLNQWFLILVFTHSFDFFNFILHLFLHLTYFPHVFPSFTSPPLSINHCGSILSPSNNLWVRNSLNWVWNPSKKNLDPFTKTVLSPSLDFQPHHDFLIYDSLLFDRSYYHSSIVFDLTFFCSFYWWQIIFCYSWGCFRISQAGKVKNELFPFHLIFIFSFFGKLLHLHIR